MKKNIVVIEGDGIGPEVTRQSVKVLNAVAECFHHEFHYRYYLMGAVAIEKQAIRCQTKPSKLHSKAMPSSLAPSVIRNTTMIRLPK